MKIEQAKISDASKIVDININEWINTYTGIFPTDFLENLKNKKEESIEKCKNKINEYVVCKIDNQVIGFLRYGKNKKGYSDEYCEIYSLYIDKNYQHKGIGSDLIAYAFEILKPQYKYVLISTLVQNSANEFYQKIGGELLKQIDFKLESNVYQENLYLFTL